MKRVSIFLVVFSLMFLPEAALSGSGNTDEGGGGESFNLAPPSSPIQKSANESAIQKAKKQRKRLMFAALISGGVGAYLLKCQCNLSTDPLSGTACGEAAAATQSDPLPANPAATLMDKIGSAITGGPPGTTIGCILGPVAIAQALMMLKKSMDMKKTIAQLSGGSSKLLADMEESMNSIPDVEVPCLEDPTKTCKLVNGGTHITSLDGSPARSIKEVAENLPPHDEQTLAALEEAIKAQEETLAKARESLGSDFDPVAGLRNPGGSSSPLVGEPVPTLASEIETPPSLPSLIETPQPLPSFNQQGLLPAPMAPISLSAGTNNWMQAQCEVENSVHTVSDVGGGMVDVLCGSSGGPPANVRQTPNPPNVSSCPQTETAVAVRDAGANQWASVSCVDSASSSPLVSLRTTERGQWADVTCPAVGKVVTVRMANTDRWVSVLCGDLQAGQVVSLRSGRSIGTDGALYAQFAGSSFGSDNIKEDVESLPFGNDRIASVNENLFAVVGTQYQHHRNNGEFMEEGPNNNAPPFVIPVIPASSGTQ